MLPLSVRSVALSGLHSCVVSAAEIHGKAFVFSLRFACPSSPTSRAIYGPRSQLPWPSTPVCITAHATGHAGCVVGHLSSPYGTAASVFSAIVFLPRTFVTELDTRKVLNMLVPLKAIKPMPNESACVRIKRDYANVNQWLFSEFI